MDCGLCEIARVPQNPLVHVEVAVDHAIDIESRAEALDRSLVQERARARFDVDRMVDGYLDVYEKVLRHAGGLA